MPLKTRWRLISLETQKQQRSKSEEKTVWIETHRISLKMRGVRWAFILLLSNPRFLPSGI